MRIYQKCYCGGTITPPAEYGVISGKNVPGKTFQEAILKNGDGFLLRSSRFGDKVRAADESGIRTFSYKPCEGVYQRLEK